MHSIIKSPKDERAYRKLVLKNGLQVILISDPSAAKAAAAMDLRVGSADDPQNREGLAHFIEHLLFLGTKSYPKADDFDRFIEKHHGNAPAYTDDEHTHYAFDIEATHLAEALERFAEFFFAPLFNSEWIERERFAIDAEYLQDIQQDPHRIAAVLYATTANPEHPLSRFKVGKLSTLVDRPNESLEQALRAFYRRYYTADRMSLAVIGPFSFNHLELLIAPFKNIPGARLSPARSQKLLFSRKELNKHIEIVPISYLRELSFYFPIPSQQNNYRQKPASIISYLLGQEGPGSLFEHFRNLGWVENINADSHTLSTEQDELYLSLDLTELGSNKLQEISEDVFAYLDYLKINADCEEVYATIVKADQRNFLFQEREEEIHLVSDLAFQQHFVPTQDLLSCHYILDASYPKEAIKNLFTLLTPENCRRVWVDTLAKTTKHDPFYKTAYEISPLNFIKTTRLPPAFENPEKNIFLPENFELLPGSSSTEKPKIILKNDKLKLWHCLNNSFQLPKVDLYLYLKSPASNKTPLDHLYLSFFHCSVNDQLSYYRDRFVIAGLHYSLRLMPDGLLLYINCYSDKVEHILNTFLNLICDHKPEPLRFDILKRNLLESLKDVVNELPCELVCEDLESLLTSPDWLPKDCLEYELDLTYLKTQCFIKDFIDTSGLVAFLHGNFSKKETLALFKAKHISKLWGAALKDKELVFYQHIKLPAASNNLWFSYSEQADPAICLYFQAAKQDLKTQALLSLLAQLMKTAFFHQLRTVEQLGYTVILDDLSLGKVYGLRFVIQSSEHSAFRLLERIWHFLEEYPKQLAAYTSNDLKAFKTALTKALQMPAKYLGELSDHYWHDILLGLKNFQTREELASLVAKISLSELQTFYKALFLNPKTRRQLVCMTRDNTVPHQRYYTQITEPDTFKRACIMLQ